MVIITTVMTTNTTIYSARSSRTLSFCGSSGLMPCRSHTPPRQDGRRQLPAARCRGMMTAWTQHLTRHPKLYTRICIHILQFVCWFISMHTHIYICICIHIHITKHTGPRLGLHVGTLFALPSSRGPAVGRHLNGRVQLTLPLSLKILLSDWKAEIRALRPRIIRDGL